MIEADVSTLEAASAAAPSDAKSDSLLTTREVSGAIESGREHSRILLAAYHFPPSAAVGGLRVTRFARFLPEFGWRPFVLTVEDADRGGDEGTDVSRLAGLEALQITRARRRSGLSNLYRRIRRSVSRHEIRRTTRDDSTAARAENAGRETFARRVRRYATSLLVLLPDVEKNWAVFAALPAVRLIWRHRIDCILTSAPPFSVHFIGLVAKRLTPVTWVADFRDPWVEFIATRDPQSRSGLSQRLEEWMEALVMRHADKVLVTTERMRASIMARYPHLPDAKFACLPNGIDVSRVTADESPGKYDRFTITYAGSFYMDRTPEPLFAALGALVQDGKALPDDVCIKLIGSCHYIGAVETRVVARRYGVERSVEIIERVPHAEAIRVMQRSHLLLVLAPPNHQLVQPAKVFDYLGSGSKLLALAEPGATVDLIQETGSGTFFSQKDISGLKAYLHGLITDGSFRYLRNDPEAFRRYDARRLTGQLVDELSSQQVRRNVGKCLA